MKADELLVDEEPDQPVIKAENPKAEISPYASPDARYNSYVIFYSNLDSLIWRNFTTLLAAIGLGAAAVSTVIEKKINVSPFTTGQTAAVICFFIGALILLNIFVLWRMRYHHELVEAELRKLEPSGYFHERLYSTQNQWWLAAPLWTGVFFATVAAGAITLGFWLLWNGT